MIFVLSIILFILCILVGGTRGIKSFVVLFVDIIFCILNIFLLGIGFPIIPTTFILCILLTLIILFFVNGYNKKTISSFISTIIILTLLMVIAYFFISYSKIAGFGEEYSEEIAWCSYNININLIEITISSIIIGLIGSIIDTSTAISTSVYEVFDKNKHLSKKELLKSGMNVGTDVIGTVTNTLFFAFLGGFLTLIIWFNKFNYSFLTIINNKEFVSEFIAIMFNALGSLLIIPTTNHITCFILTNKDNKIVKKIEESIDYHNY